MKKKVEPHIEDIEKERHAKEYVLRLFITGATPNSVRALTNIKDICDDHLAGNYRLEIIDVYQQRELAQKEQLIALPLLVKKLPPPERKLIGDLSDTEKVLKILGLAQP
ncbi:circadian clock KaiB family protein [Flavisolibacter ginsenosidimutans]|uniref:Circadian clock protein KaiB n=1 Tax=Flavisolibacter ginsenosidimutans TaxID=661481 RepID=A0A5B8UKJ4_9BACT|nr:circadian clock KaiB family protein [Flavisolibacter ginsenosidimutans]QEC57211.1 circadian clock protein KaiB [Flavisolibacter ginsenosidimutans]